MQVFNTLALAVLAHGVGALKTASMGFGPGKCVSLTRSPAGSCVLATDCQSLDISKTEFSFDCVSQHRVMRHSFGVGGFEANEEFDTEVKCDRCTPILKADAVAKKPAPARAKKMKAHTKKAIHRNAPPPAAPVRMAQSVPVKHEVTYQVPGAVATYAEEPSSIDKEIEDVFDPKPQKAKPEVVEYGPEGCVSLYKSSEDHCMMQTKCKKVEENQFEHFEFGLVCVDKNGSPVKHLFGKDSFDEEETFDTLIKCDQCLGLEDLPDNIILAGEVATMAKDVSNLKAVIKNISTNVEMLNKEVFRQQAPAPAPISFSSPSIAPAGPPKAPKALVHQSVKHYKRHGNLRHSHRHHHRHQDDDDDEERKYDDDRDDRREEDGDDDRDENAQRKQPSLAEYSAPVVKVQMPLPAQDDDDDDAGDDDGFD